MNSVSQLETQDDVFANIRGWAAPELLTFLDQILVLLPEELKYQLKKVMDVIPPDSDNVHRVLELVRSQWKELQSYSLARIVLVGPAQTGKDSLIKAILRKQERGQEGAAASIFSIVDLRILEKYLGQAPAQPEPEGFGRADVILFILDARYDLADATVQLYERLESSKKPVLVVLNKIDLLEHSGRALKKAKRQLGTAVFGVSSFQTETLDKLLRAVVTANPKTLYSLTRNFPEFRQAICNGIVTRAAFAAGVIGAVPIPVSDLLPLIAIQTAMILRIARAFGYRLNRQRARELLPVLAGGALVREGTHRLRSRFPQYRELIAVSVGGAWTFILGRAAIQYFGKLSRVLNDENLMYFPRRT